jgi:hypothetical protein
MCAAKILWPPALAAALLCECMPTQLWQTHMRMCTGAATLAAGFFVRVIFVADISASKALGKP